MTLKYWISVLKKKQREIAAFILLLLLYSIAASQAIQSFSYKWTTVAANDQYSLDRVLEGTAPKPYAYRLLIPKIINCVVGYAPNQLLHPILARSRNTLSATIGSDSILLNDTVTTSYGLILIFNFFLLVITLFLLRELGEKMLLESGDYRKVVVDFSPVIFALLLSISYRVSNGFIYDHFELFAIALYLFFSWNGRWLLSIFVLILAIFNKETAIFFPVFGFIISYTCYRQEGIRRSVIEFIVVLLGFAFVRYLLRNHPGNAVE